MKKLAKTCLKCSLLCFLFSLVIPLQTALAVDQIIAGGDFHSTALSQDMAVWSWGMNTDGQLGDGTNENRKTSVQAAVIANANSVHGNGNFTLALKDKTVWAWGRNTNGQLGDGTNENRNTPVQVPDLDRIIAVACGENHAVALRNDNTVWAWGSNLYGQLGDGTTNDRNTPVQVPGLDSVVAVACGDNHTIALRSDGTILAWGYNNHGQIGDGTTLDKNTPIQVSSIDEFKSIAAGGNHTLAIKKSDGTVWAWGMNTEGQLGDGTNTDKNTPVQVSNLGNVSTVVGGNNHTVALREDGAVWTWGRNNEGQLGDGTYEYSPNRLKVPGLAGVTAIAAGGNHTIVLKGDSTVWTWGDNSHGQLGDGTTINRNTPVQTKGLWGQDYIAISISPESHDFGYAEVGASSSVQIFEIANTGTSELVIGTISKSGTNPNDFTVQNDACSGKTLALSGKCTVEAIFSPGSGGDKSAIIEIPSNDPGTPLEMPLSGTGLNANISVWPASYNFETVEAGSDSPAKSFKISNAGTADLVIGTITKTGTGADEFVIQNDSCSGATVTQTDNCTFEAVFSPASGGDKSAVIKIPSNDPSTPVQDVLLSGTGAQSTISVFPDSYDFGLVEVGASSSAQIFEITNTGLTELSIVSIIKSGTDTDDFVIQNDSCSGKTIGPSGKCAVEAIFSPGAKGEKNADIEISTNISVVPALVLLSGTGKKTAVLSVCASACEYATIQSAIDTTYEGDVIKLEAGTYYEMINTDDKEIVLSIAAKKTADADGDGVISLAEAIYALQVIAGLK
ncbi:MAG: choice-of-anchor D domain-containing protein [Desulfobacteraceae bacterium]|nr:choice-of-anchor D domain-containing protein [Desulfobacteraceae bacterium]